MLRMQVELSRVLWRHLGPVLEQAAGGTPGGWAQAEEVLGGPLSLVAQEPYLFPDSGAEARVEGGAIVELELLGAAPRRAVLAVDERALGPRGDPAMLPPLLRRLLDGAPVRVGGLRAPHEVSAVLGRPGQMILGLDLSLRGPAGDRWARLLVGAELRLAAPPPMVDALRLRLWQRRGRLAEVPVELRIQAGEGTLPAGEVAELQVGDVVVLDRFGPRPVVGGPVKLRLGRGAFPAHLDGRGVTLLGAYQLEWTGAMAHEPPTGNEDAGTERLLRELPVQLTCELGRITLTGQEVLELRPGAVLPVGRPLAGPVDLCAGGRVIARGELVEVEGEMGVRVTEVLD